MIAWPARISLISARLEHLGEVRASQARAEHLQQLALGRDAGDLALGRRIGRHQLERGAARYLDARSRPRRADRGAALAARDQPDLADDRALRRSARCVDGSFGSTSTSTEPSAIANSEAPGSLRSNTIVAGAIGERLGIEHELAHLQRRQVVEDRRPGGAGRRAIRSTAAAARQDGELAARGSARRRA